VILIANRCTRCAESLTGWGDGPIFLKNLRASVFNDGLYDISNETPFSQFLLDRQYRTFKKMLIFLLTCAELMTFKKGCPVRATLPGGPACMGGRPPTIPGRVIYTCCGPCGTTVLPASVADPRSGSRILIFYPSRIQEGPKRHQIPDPDPRHC
jgi:hypothetical protein